MKIIVKQPFMNRTRRMTRQGDLHIYHSYPSSVPVSFGPLGDELPVAVDTCAPEHSGVGIKLIRSIQSMT
jgi:hypothetical protein